MYEEFYGFLEKPFSLTPDPKYLYRSESHGNAFELLQYAIRRREGFVVITGDIGTGKTTICRALLEQIDRRTFTALVLNPFLSEEDLLRLILQDFGVVSRADVKDGKLAGVSKQELIDAIYDFLLGLLPLQASALLIIDEAQNLPRSVLEQIRILSNLETDKEKLLQVILVGQLNLQAQLRAPELRQLDQRVSIRYELKPLTREETGAYIAHRLAVAGGTGTIHFEASAVDQIFRHSQGIPRLVNLLCDRALLAAFSERVDRVTPMLVNRAAESLDLDGGSRAPRRMPTMNRTAAAVVAGVGAAALAMSMTAAVVSRTSGGIVDGSTPLATGSSTPLATGGSTPLATSTAAASGTGALDPHPARATRAPTAIEPTPWSQPSGSSAAPGREMPTDARYTVLVASFPVGDPEIEAGSVEHIDSVTGRLQQLGYDVFHADVDLASRGRWRRVLVGAFSELGHAEREEARLKMMREFGEARALTSAVATARGASAKVGSRQ